MPVVIDNQNSPALSITQDKIPGSHRIFLAQDFKVLSQFSVAACDDDLSIAHLAKISAQAQLDAAEEIVYGPARQRYVNYTIQKDPTDYKDSLRYLAHLKSIEYAKAALDSGVTDAETIAEQLHEGYISVAEKFVQNPDQFKNAQLLRETGRLHMLLLSVNKLASKTYEQLDSDSVEKRMYQVIAQALLKVYKYATP